MGWFWDSKKPGSSDDAYSKLDPSLRDFLNQESHQKQEETTSQSQPTSGTYRSQLGFDGSEQHAQEKPAVPLESEFQDGRYAHLWKNYRPQAEIEAAGKTEQDQMREIVEAFNDRRAAIGRAAMENCVLEQMAERDCWENGSWSDRMNMCRGPTRQFNRCYTMQSRFLKALGYLSVVRSEEEDEKIQMHADSLYHRMLERQRLVEEAEKEGLPAPQLPPLIDASATTAALGESSAFARNRKRAMEVGWSGSLSSYAPEKRAAIMKKIAGMNEREKELELQLIAAESRAHMDIQEKYYERLRAESEARADRRQRGKETAGDTIKRLWGWDGKQ
ncbi:hypothetical protein Tdes44962_MAKER04067 [Teratosphaeria destructans]|uniref:Autophagy protein n=1 Tax=Teratosphaeria destructans TaxID=418781 RepID=A0A9W7W0V1_9PEZI|nr:hypothetical protein Tdes44962_MAKER04067 [Teratosphaeria destructans]